MAGPAVPDKLFYRIGEVSRITSLRPSVLRFWESEFEVLSPKKSGTGQRLYSRQDLDLLLEIKRLLYTERLTIEGTKKRLRRKTAGPEKSDLRALLLEIRSELEELRNRL